MKAKRGHVIESYKTYPFKPKTKQPESLTRNEYAKVVTQINRARIESLIQTGEPATLPCRLGEFQIVKFKPKNPIFNRVLYLRTGVKSNYTNLHTDGYTVRIHWKKKDKANFKNKKIWSFDFTRNQKRYGSKSLVGYIKENGVDQYLEK